MFVSLFLSALHTKAKPGWSRIQSAYSLHKSYTHRHIRTSALLKCLPISEHKKQKQRNSNWVLNYKLPFEHPEKKIQGRGTRRQRAVKWTKFDLTELPKNTLTSMGLERVRGEGWGINEQRYWMCKVGGAWMTLDGCDERECGEGGGTNDCTVYKSVWTLGWWLKWESES